MSNFDQIDEKLLQIGELQRMLQEGVYQSVWEAVSGFKVSLTMDLSSELSIQIFDKNLAFTNANTFSIRRDVFYRELMFEISRLSISQGRALDPIVGIEARDKNIQMMKRDKQPEAYNGISGTEFAKQIATRFNMGFFGEDTPRVKAVVKASGSDSDESVWDVMQRIAGEMQFVVFQTNNILFFTSQEHLLGRWGDPRYQYEGKTFIPFIWPQQDESRFPGSTDSWILTEAPSLSKSDDDPMAAEGTIMVERTNGVLLRPGMTIYLAGINEFDDYYLITSVDFNEGVVDPVRVNFRTPVPFEERRTPSGGGGGGRSRGGGGSRSGGSTGGVSPQSSTLPANISNSISEYIRRNIQSDSQWVSAQGSSGAQAQLLQARINDAIAAAERIWRASTTQEKNNLLDQARRNFGAGDIRFRAINSVRGQLSQNRTQEIGQPAPASGTPSFTSIANQIRTFIRARVQIASLRASLEKDAVDAALNIYRVTTRSGQVNRLSSYRNRFNGDVRYQALKNVENLLIFRPFPQIAPAETVLRR